MRYASELRVKRRFYTTPLVVTTNRDPFRSQTGPVREVWYEVDQVQVPPGKELYGKLLTNVPLDRIILEGGILALPELKQGASITMSLLREGQRIKLHTATRRRVEAAPRRCGTGRGAYRPVPQRRICGRTAIGVCEALGREDRREFARFFGLWCAHGRHQAAPK